MDIMEALLEVIKYILPAGLVLLAVRWMQQSRQAEKDQELQFQWQQQVKKNHLPLVFHAYERALLFLARLEPDQLLGRTPSAGLTATQFARQLEQDIKEEFEHNLAQQLYILPGTWDEVMKAQVAVRGLVLGVLRTLPEGASGQDLFRGIWEAWTAQQQPVTYRAMIMLKKDVQGWLIGMDRT